MVVEAGLKRLRDGAGVYYKDALGNGSWMSSEH